MSYLLSNAPSWRDAAGQSHDERDLDNLIEKSLAMPLAAMLKELLSMI
jgi:hypothetical protein